MPNSHTVGAKAGSLLPYIGVRQHPETYSRIIQNFRLIWLDSNIDAVNDNDYRDNIMQLRRTVNSIEIFTNADQCIRFLTNIKDEKVFLIVSGHVGQRIVPLIHNMPQLDSIYVLCGNKSRHEQWAKQWSKIKGVLTEISSIYELLKPAARQCDHNTISISFVPASGDTSHQNVDKLDQSFMYTQILKEILLTIDFDASHITEFANYCRLKFSGNNYQILSVDIFERKYRQHSPIWWYTSESFLHSMLNRALRLMDVDTIVKLGFYVSDLHRHIEQLYLDQLSDNHQSQPFNVYRGQGLSKTDFDRLMKTPGRLMSFNNFLSTSRDQYVSIAFAESCQNNPDMIGVLFEITLDPSKTSTPFAFVNEVSFYTTENEILVSMHAIFRIGDIKQMTNETRLWKVEITLTDDADPELTKLTEHMQKQTEERRGWYRLGSLLLDLGQFDKAQQLFETLLDQTNDDSQHAFIYQLLGTTKNGLGQYSKALSYYEKALEIQEETLPANHPDLANSYSNMGQAYSHIGEYSKALSYYQKALGIQEETFPANHPDLATSYNKIGQAYSNRGEYFIALSYYEKALEIQEETLPANHPDLANSYSNMGQAYSHIGEYSKALSYYEKALGMRQKSLPINHPHLASSYSYIGQVYSKIGEYCKALSYYEKDLKITQDSLLANHPDVATSYSNIGQVYSDMGEYSKALSYYEKALRIDQESLPANHPDLATTYSNIGQVYSKIGEYCKALSYYEKDLKITQESLPANHPDLATSYSNIGQMYSHVGEYSKALSYYEKALGIQEETLPANHPSLATSYSNIGQVYSKIGEYCKALSYYEKDLKITQESLLANHPDLATSYSNIGQLYSDMGEYSKALSYYEMDLKITQESLSPNHPDLATSYSNIGQVYSDMGEYSRALSYYEKAVIIQRETLPSNHPHVTNSLRSIGVSQHGQEEENYELKILAYQELLAYITQFMNTLTKVFSQSFTEYRKHVDEFWDDIQRGQNQNNAQSYLRQFLCETEWMFHDAIPNNIESLLKAIEAKLNVLTEILLLLDVSQTK